MSYQQLWSEREISKKVIRAPLFLTETFKTWFIVCWCLIWAFGVSVGRAALSVLTSSRLAAFISAYRISFPVSVSSLFIREKKIYFFISNVKTSFPKETSPHVCLIVYSIEYCSLLLRQQCLPSFVFNDFTLCVTLNHKKSEIGIILASRPTLMYLTAIFINDKLRSNCSFERLHFPLLQVTKPRGARLRELNP